MIYVLTSSLWSFEMLRCDDSTSRVAITYLKLLFLVHTGRVVETLGRLCIIEHSLMHTRVCSEIDC